MILEQNTISDPVFATDDIIDPESLQNNCIEPTSERKLYGFNPAGVKPERNFINWLFRTINQHIEWVKTVFWVQVDHYLELHDGKITVLESDVLGLDSRLSTIEPVVSDHEDRITTNEGNIGALGGAVTAIDGRVTDAEEDIAALNISVPAIGNRVTALENITEIVVPAYVPSNIFQVRTDFNFKYWKKNGMVYLVFPQIDGILISNSFELIIPSWPADMHQKEYSVPVLVWITRGLVRKPCFAYLEHASNRMWFTYPDASDTYRSDNFPIGFNITTDFQVATYQALVGVP